MKNKSWAELPCGIPGYEITAGEYAKTITMYAQHGKYEFVKRMVDAMHKANRVAHIEMAQIQLTKEK